MKVQNVLYMQQHLITKSYSNLKFRRFSDHGTPDELRGTLSDADFALNNQL